VAVCDVSPSFFEKSYDVSFAIAYDVISAGNSLPVVRLRRAA